jgi:cytochrome P450
VIGRLLFSADVDAAIGQVGAAIPVLNRYIHQRIVSPVRWPRSWPTDAASLARTTRVVKEALRLYPPVYGIGRRTGAAGTVGGHLLPAGSVVVVSPWVTHRHPRHWSDPDRFDPDRFAPEREAGRHRYAYLPFGAGPRACLGSHLAMLEAVIATAVAVRDYRLETPRGPVALTTGITLRPAASVPCTLTRRR